MFRRRRADTLAGTVEREYGIDLNVRGDARLGKLLKERGFESLSQLLRAYRGRVSEHARLRRVFLTFHAEDRNRANGFRLMASNPALRLDFVESSSRAPVDSERSSYIRRVLRQRIDLASVIVCLIGNGTGWREWVDWELETGWELGKGLCGVRLRNTHGRAPRLFHELDAPIVRWDHDEIIAAIEAAAARRS